MPELEHELLRFPRFPMGSPTYYEISKVFEKIGEPSLPALAVGLNHWRDCGRVFSTMTLMALREKSAPMTPAVVSAWRSVGTDERVPGTDTRWDSRKEKFYDGYSSEPSNTRGMKRFGPEAIPTLIRALDDPHGNVRMRAATALGSFESVAKSALPALVRRLNDDQRYVAQAAAEAILLIVPVDAPEAGAARAKLGTK
jgi:hypothetical protein